MANGLGEGVVSGLRGAARILSPTVREEQNRETELARARNDAIQQAMVEVANDLPRDSEEFKKLQGLIGEDFAPMAVGQAPAAAEPVELKPTSQFVIDQDDVKRNVVFDPKRGNGVIDQSGAFVPLSAALGPGGFKLWEKPERREGKRVNAEVNGRIVPAIERDGRLYDPQTGNRMPNAILARKRVEQGTPEEFTGTKGQLGEDVRVADFISDALTTVDTLEQAIREDPTNFGVFGSVKRGLQTGVGIAKDLTSIIGEDAVKSVVNTARDIVDSGAMDDLPLGEQADLFSPQLSLIDIYENSLGLTLARTMHPEGRVPVDVIRRSIKDVQLTGLKSSRDVQNRLAEIRRRFESKLRSAEKRLGREERKGPTTRIRYDAQGNVVEVSE